MTDQGDLFYEQQIAEIRRRTWAGIRNRGNRCPVCETGVSLYRRPLGEMHAASLIWLYRMDRREPERVWWHLLSDCPYATGDHAKLVHWGLTDKEPHPVKIAKKDTGHYRITGLGREFVEQKRQMPSHAYVLGLNNILYPDEFPREDKEDRMIWIYECIGKKFNFQKLMAGEL